ncbi:hypothetical protein [Geomonas paludis]|uniref:Fibronectin type-III domain-containing protein n=1 Tax=Geomonas paludis TaxID=2740185 RepID=A0A6V8MZ42_9BACT|nr:hypothetical protein [Geomonas paludis]GFO64439.1 hypothetical protein GMPD_23580 [Geomonas paludis]
MTLGRAVALLLLGATLVTESSALGAVSAASVAGTYSFVNQESGFVVGDRYSRVFGSTGTISFDGTGTCTFSYSGTGYEVASEGPGAVTVAGSHLSKTATTCSYTVSPTGILDVSADTDTFSFFLSPDSNMFTTGAAAARSDVGGPAGLSAKQMVAVKNGSSLTNASLAGTYRFVGQDFGLRQAAPGTVSDLLREVAGSLTFDGNGGCSISSEGKEFVHGDSFAANTITSPPASCSYSVAATGLVTLTTTTGTSALLMTPDGGTLIGGGAETVNQDYLSRKLVAVKAPADMSGTSLKGSYNFSYQEARFYAPSVGDGSGTSGLDKGISGGNGQIEFDGDGMCYFTYGGQGLGNSLWEELPVNDPILCSYVVSPDGQVDVAPLIGDGFSFWLENGARRGTGGTPLGYNAAVGDIYKVRQIVLVQPTPIAAAPQSITVPAADADGSYLVTWSASATNGAAYILQEATDAHFTQNVQEYQATDPSLLLTGKTAGRYYYYRVKASLTGYADSEWTNSATGCAVPGTPVPSVGSLNVPAQSSDGNFTVTWSASAVNGATYVLQEATDPTFSGSLREAYQGTATGTTITGALVGTTFYYRIKAFAPAYQDSSWQTSETGCKVGPNPAAAPADITVPAVGPDGTFQVSWSASATQGATYLLQEATDANFATGLREAYRGSATSTAITGGVVDSTYYYRVKTVASGYEDSAWQASATGCKVTALVPVAAPLTITVPVGDLDGSYTVSWGASATKGVTYLLQEAADAAFTQMVQEYQVATLGKLVTGKQLGNRYFYRVKAVREGYADSTWKTAAAPCAVPGTTLAPLASLTVPTVDADGSYTVRWSSPVTGGVTYVLQQATNATFTAGVTEAYRGSETSASISGGVTGTTYFYRVRAVKSGYKDSAWKTQAVGCKVIGMGVAAAVPLTLAVPTADIDGIYAVYWGASATKGVTYLLQEATDAAFTQSVQEYAVSGLRQAITGRSQDTVYYYRVKAVHPEYADSAWKTAAAACAVPGALLPALTMLTASATQQDGSYQLSWNSSSKAGVTYVLQEANNSTFTMGVREAYRGEAVTAPINGRSPGVSYYYRVKVVKTGYKDSTWKMMTGFKKLPL